jgi:NAD(P)-dependent dehydrogenase (short-subunit alcohol dehydrogenase family)
MQKQIRALGPTVLGDATYGKFLVMKQSGRLKAPEEVARLAVFLASDDCDKITGLIGTERDFQHFGYRG